MMNHEMMMTVGKVETEFLFFLWTWACWVRRVSAIKIEEDII